MRPAGARIELGAGVTMAQILGDRELAFLHPAARAVGGPAIRTMATVGGNLFAPSPYGDFTTALLALDATRRHAGRLRRARDAARGVPRGRERGPRGLVASVAFARPPSPDVFRFRKVARVKPKGISVLSIAALLPLAGGRIAGARVAYGAMAPTPMRAQAVERALEGRALDAPASRAAVAVAAEGTSPASDAIASDWYRREMVAGASAAPAARQTAERRDAMSKTAVQFRHNGTDVAVFVDGGANLLTALRDGVGDTSPKFGCGQGTCGVCTVLIDGEPHLRCLTLAETVPGPRGRDRRRPQERRRACIRCRSRSWSISPPSAASARRAC